MNDLTHIDTKGAVRMVDVTHKAATVRTAIARGAIIMAPATLERILDQRLTKGNVLETARIAGIMAAKKTAFLIPMCHPLLLTAVRIDFMPACEASRLLIESEVSVTGPTGVEMEALTAVAGAALTVYDMCKAIDRAMSIQEIRLVEKSGGRSGHYQRPGESV